MTIPTRQIRAVYDDKTIRVYQAYSDAIADSTLEHGTFQSPAFKMERMTWIKPSFLWMMYRSGWGKKDSGQKRILAIDITREGFEWALEHSLLSHDAYNYKDKEEWLKVKKATPVRIQWDPERDLHLQPLEHRAIQIGLTNEAVLLYVNKWVQNITDVTDFASEIHMLVNANQLTSAKSLLPKEAGYPINSLLAKQIELTK
ncbi:DUF4291 domain-containing protein [Shewanella algae]|uniref:DUF4291 domain-containing protein n=1 Tax=Shewanella algae TaxID=38313 RepID=UPI00118226E1|nr:DUF4291 domain-containing protein [Shewanella algae]TVL16403.1 hypothetical protein AYJ02_07345 [Shewanella algae]